VEAAALQARGEIRRIAASKVKVGSAQKGYLKKGQQAKEGAYTMRTCEGFQE